MSVETSRKFSWLANTRALADLPRTVQDRVTRQINHVETEKDFTAETLAVIKNGEQEMKESSRM